MIVVRCQQGSPEWFAERAGAITASMFAEVRKRVGGLTPQQEAYVASLRAGEPQEYALQASGYKRPPTADVVARALRGEPVGDFTEAAKNYAFRLAIERISGECTEGDEFETFAMRRGRELEPKARERHEFEAEVTVVPTGLVLTDDRKFGASADGLIEPDGGSEYKCLVSPERIRHIVLDRDITEFADQNQGCMWLTGRSWWHFCLYCPALESVGRALTMFHVDRDDDYINALELDLLAFDRLVCEYETKLRDKAE